MVSGGEIFVVLLFVLLFFGANKIPELAKGLGKGMREFKKASDDIKREISSVDGGILSDVKKDIDEIKGNLTETFEKEAINPADDLADALNQASSDDSPYSTGVVASSVVASSDSASSDDSVPDSGNISSIPDVSSEGAGFSSNDTDAADVSANPLDEPVMEDYYYNQPVDSTHDGTVLEDNRVTDPLPEV